MRKKFVFIVLVPLIVVGVLLYFFLDSWIEAGLELAGEKTVGAKVEIDNLRLGLFPLGAEFSRLQVANIRDPWKNVFETGKVKFAVDFGQILRGKYIIETMEVNDLTLGTKRATDGSLPKKTEPVKAPVNQSVGSSAPASITEQAQPALETETKKTPMFDLDRLKKEFKVDSLLNVQNLASVRHYDSLRSQLEQANRQWQTTLGEFDQSKQKAAEIEVVVKSINVAELKSLDAITGAISKANTAQKNASELYETFKNQKTALTTDINRLSVSAGMVDDLAKQDFQMMLRLARLPDVDMKGIAEVLIGKDLYAQAMESLHWIDFARETVPQYIPKPDKTKPPRLEGQTIHFPSEQSYPKFWIKKILVSGGEDKAQKSEYFYARGEVLNITSNQKQTGFPMTISLFATRSDRTSFSFDASFDRRPEVPVDEYKLRATGVPIAQMALGRSDFLPSKIIDTKAAFGVDIQVPGRRFDAQANIAFSEMNVQFERSATNTVERIVRDVLESIKGFQVTLRMWNTAESFNIALATDLDNQIANRTKQVIGAEIARMQNELRSKVNQRIAQERQKYEKLYSDKKEEVLARVRQHESVLNEKLALVEEKKKELENRLDAEKKKQTEGVTKKAEEAIKGIIKRKQ
jgi:uncharacterized protein (TIGR03545 family)